MDLDRLLREKKHLAELDDTDIETFLRDRKFRAEHLNIEFKSGFPEKQNNKYEIKKICKYVVGFSNEEGGLVVYGVADDVKNLNPAFPDYVPGLRKHPTLEDLSLWVKDRVHPLAASPAIRFFQVATKTVAILKIPSGVNKPYCYYEPDTRSITYFQKTAGGIVELTPDEVREFHRTQILAQSQLIVQVADSQRMLPSPSTGTKSDTVVKHATGVRAKLENPKDFGLVRIYCRPLEKVDILVANLQKFLQEHGRSFSEAMRYFQNIDAFQNGVSVAYAPTGFRKDAKSTVRVSLYSDSFVAFDALVDTFLAGDRELHSGWLCYELPRQLQLTKAVLKGSNATRVHLELDFEHVEAFQWVVIENRLWGRHASYTGSHEPIERDGIWPPFTIMTESSQTSSCR
ncbi:MAG: ATP-binding protein [Candidatus Sulfotelmatobacter sp.]